MQIAGPGRASIISSKTPNPDDEGLHVVHRTEPHSGIIYSDSIEAEPQISKEVVDEGSSRGKRVVVLFVIVLGFSIFAAGTIYWIESRRFPVVVAISPPDGAKDPSGNSSTLIPLSPDLIHVTSIALGNPRLTIVNGKRLAEEDWLIVKTPLGEASVRVISIQDGFVRFKHGGNTIDAQLELASVSPPPH